VMTVAFDSVLVFVALLPEPQPDREVATRTAAAPHAINVAMGELLSRIGV